MIAELQELERAAVDAVSYRMKELGEPLDVAARAVEASLRDRGIEVNLHLSTDPSAPLELGENAGVYEVTTS